MRAPTGDAHVDIDIIRPSDLSTAEVERWTALQAADAELASPFLSAHWPIAVERAQTSAASGVRVAILHQGGKVRGFFPARVQGATAMLHDPGLPRGGVWTTKFLHAPSLRIAGGSDQVQGNIIGERVLGLPAEARADKDIPFRDLAKALR